MKQGLVLLFAAGIVSLGSFIVGWQLGRFTAFEEAHQICHEVWGAPSLEECDAPGH